jgi:lipoprotein
MRKYYGILLLALGILSSCEKVKDLSDEASVTSLTIQSYSPETAKIGEVEQINNTFLIPVLPEKDLFPLKINVDMKTSSTTDDILGDFQKELTFESGYNIKNFHLISESGIPYPYRIMLKAGDTGADILNIPEIQIDRQNVTDVDPWDAKCYIYISKPVYPLELPIKLDYSEGAILTNFNGTLHFTDATTIQKITIKSKDGKVTRDWEISTSDLQIPNSDFQEWGKTPGVNQGVETIKPIPMVGRSWATANNNYICGTLPVQHGKENEYAAQMTTDVQNVPLFGDDLIAAGTLYTGQFKLNFNFEDPRSMTYFGIPLRLRVDSVSFEAKYEPGPQMKQSVKNDKGTFKVQNIDGVDRGHMWVEILNWSGEGEMAYNGRPIDGLTVLGRAEIIFEGTDPKVKNWHTVKLAVKYTDLSLNPTHISVVMTSSKEGDKFKGAPGSTLTVDNFQLIYK